MSERKRPASDLFPPEGKFFDAKTVPIVETPEEPIPEKQQATLEILRTIPEAQRRGSLDEVLATIAETFDLDLEKLKQSTQTRFFQKSGQARIKIENTTWTIIGTSQVSMYKPGTKEKEMRSAIIIERGPLEKDRLGVRYHIAVALLPETTKKFGITGLSTESIDDVRELADHAIENQPEKYTVNRI